jgi:hypothetical protein
MTLEISVNFTTVAQSTNQLEEAYGGWAHSLLDMMAFQIARITGAESESDHFVHRIYGNGLLVPVPCDLDTGAFTELQIREIFCKALSRTVESQQMASHGADTPDCLKRSMALAEDFCKPSALM